MDHVERCKRIAAAVETLSQTETEELFRIIHKHGFDYTRNNHGVFINLSWVPSDLLKEMDDYVTFCHQSKHELRKYESLCDALNTKIVGDASPSDATARQTRAARALLPKASASGPAATAQEDEAAAERKDRVSASMRFYLLKKKFAKMGSVPNLESDLSREDYPIAS
jgi:hypothetical protein